MEKILSKAQFLNNDYILNIEDFITEPATNNQSSLPTPPLGKTPQPVVNNMQMASAKDPITNLTGTEEAVLSPMEKVIAGRT